MGRVIVDPDACTIVQGSQRSRMYVRSSSREARLSPRSIAEFDYLASLAALADPWFLDTDLASVIS